MSYERCQLVIIVPYDVDNDLWDEIDFYLPTMKFNEELQVDDGNTSYSIYTYNMTCSYAEGWEVAAAIEYIMRRVIGAYVSVTYAWCDKIYPMDYGHMQWIINGLQHLAGKEEKDSPRWATLQKLKADLELDNKVK